MRRVFLFLIAFLATACGDQHQTVELRFAGLLNGEPASCAESGDAMSDLRFYVSDVRFIGDAKHSVPAHYVAAQIGDHSPWQADGVALIDLEDGTGSCANGTPETNDRLVVTLPANDYRSGLVFTIGVPFELNHQNPLTASAPLNDSAMHWHWRSGYKFLRASTLNDAGEAWVHLGSTGCEGTVGNITGCSAPNRVTVHLMDFDSQTDRIGIELSALLDTAAMLAAGDRIDCSSGPAEAACRAPFAALGINTENPSLAGKQHVFKILR